MTLWMHAAALTLLKAAVISCLIALGAIVLGMVQAGGPLVLWPDDDEEGPP